MIVDGSQKKLSSSNEAEKQMNIDVKRLRKGLCLTESLSKLFFLKVEVILLFWINLRLSCDQSFYLVIEVFR